MPRYVILEHDHPFVHWDFMLEVDGKLQTWRLLDVPAPEKLIAATALGPHRLDYLDYEGPVSGNRGQVRRWDAGNYLMEVHERECVSVVLAGAQLHGTVLLTRNGADAKDWEFCLYKVPVP